MEGGIANEREYSSKNLDHLGPFQARRARYEAFVVIRSKTSSGVSNCNTFLGLLLSNISTSFKSFAEISSKRLLVGKY